MPGETSENHDKAEFWNFSVDLKHLKIHPEYDFRNFDQAQNRNRRKNPKNKEKTAVLPTIFNRKISEFVGDIGIIFNDFKS